MRYSPAILFAVLAAQVSAHGVITEIQGANGVNMPGLSVADGTPRDCASPGCGAEADTSIIRNKELGSNKASALGRTSTGPVDAAAAISSFMGTTKKRGLLDALTGGNGGGAGGAGKANTGGATGAGTKTAKGTTEQGVSAAAGKGATSGLPTCADDGSITMTFHQVNQDGAGPLTAAVDPTSGGTDPTAFQTAQVSQNVPGIGIGGLSGATTTDFPVKVQMPAGMTCTGSVGGAQNVCVVRMQNSALAGPFGGSAAFTQSPAAKKRAVEFNLRKRHMARGILGKPELE
ncbi:Gas2, regulated by Bmp1 MAP kinase cascade [Mytilinidion resinicola]|uniref:Gas2, regulated by Bmp1 MAP kinase cascade n=1 Tax=Mytilinidion resinicola TaxID=574789 RepID=A0A6A6Z6V9_9PEZI|nr:Gas2, regulated by Bmp1 MAP kinase cascade [Mytilinidion resinicola]KAF2816831.1 Gas2, regulated by Bmp1 MAP kinase cascade [Mytilinidion resinicola]